MQEPHVLIAMNCRTGTLPIKLESSLAFVLCTLHLHVAKLSINSHDVRFVRA